MSAPEGTSPESPNEGADAAEVKATSEAQPGETTDVARRLFFRRFASEVLQTAATVVGAATALQRDAAEAASAILDPERGAAALADGFVRVGPGPGSGSAPTRGRWASGRVPRPS